MMNKKTQLHLLLWTIHLLKGNLLVRHPQFKNYFQLAQGLLSILSC